MLLISEGLVTGVSTLLLFAGSGLVSFIGGFLGPSPPKGLKTFSR